MQKGVRKMANFIISLLLVISACINVFLCKYYFKILDDQEVLRGEIKLLSQDIEEEEKDKNNLIVIAYELEEENLELKLELERLKNKPKRISKPRTKPENETTK